MVSKLIVQRIAGVTKPLHVHVSVEYLLLELCKNVVMLNEGGAHFLQEISLKRSLLDGGYLLQVLRCEGRGTGCLNAP